MNDRQLMAPYRTSPVDSMVCFAHQQGCPWQVLSQESFGNVLFVDRRWLRGPLGVRKKYSGRSETEDTGKGQEVM